LVGLPVVSSCQQHRKPNPPNKWDKDRESILFVSGAYRSISVRMR
jgi:hypothetical protein